MSKFAPKVLIGIPTTSGAKRSVLWTDAMAGIQMPLGAGLAREWIENETIAAARNALCMKALESGIDYVFMLGDDVLPPSNVILAMLDKIGRTFPVENGTVARASMITGVYWTKTFPTEPYLWNGLLKGTYKDWQVGEWFPVDMAGCDCLMIETAMLRELEFPWFRTDWTWEEGQKPGAMATEDFYFYTKARLAGFRLFADTSLQCYHEERTTGQMFGLTEDMRQAGGTPETPLEDHLLVADIGAGLWSPAWGDNTKAIRFDARADTHPDVRCDVRAIPINHVGLYDQVHSSHVLEHFPRNEVVRLLSHWATLLKPGGKMVVRVPNVAYAMRRIVAADDAPAEARGLVDNYDWSQLYGDQQGYDTAFHRCGFIARTLTAAMRAAGLEDVTCEHTQNGLNLRATGILRTPPATPVLATMWEQIEAQERPTEAATVDTATAEAASVDATPGAPTPAGVRQRADASGRPLPGVVGPQSAAQDSKQEASHGS